MKHVMRGVGFVVAATIWVGAASLAAHHGTTISYDRSRSWTLKAVVTDFQYVNPHVQVYFDTTDDAGKVTRWSGELLPNPAMLIRNGWSRKRSTAALAPGTKVVITAAPSRAGGTTCLISRIESETGEDLLGLASPAPPPASGPVK
jgi:hypothetical protein